jgi:hemoglobin-like flavoprotein
MNPQIDPVIASYHRARESGQLFDTFYELFLGKSPEIPPMFARTDFRHQKLMVRESVLEMLQFAHSGGGYDQVRKLGDRHRELNVRREHYERWLDALCEALAQHDPEFNETLEQQWRAAMQQGIAVMVAPTNI